MLLIHVALKPNFYWAVTENGLPNYSFRQWVSWRMRSGCCVSFEIATPGSTLSISVHQAIWHTKTMVSSGDVFHKHRTQAISEIASFIVQDKRQMLETGDYVIGLFHMAKFWDVLSQPLLTINRKDILQPSYLWVVSKMWLKKAKQISRANVLA